MVLLLEVREYRADVQMRPRDAGVVMRGEYLDLKRLLQVLECDIWFIIATVVTTDVIEGDAEEPVNRCSLLLQ